MTGECIGPSSERVIILECMWNVVKYKILKRPAKVSDACKLCLKSSAAYLRHIYSLKSSAAYRLKYLKHSFSF